MDRFKNKMTEVPLCKFGPGGDYTSELHTTTLQPLNPQDEQTSPLGKVLTVIAEIIGATVQPEVLTEIACALPTDQLIAKSHSQEKTQDVQSATKPTSGSHPKAITGASENWKLSTEPMLFSNDWGTGSDAQRKSNHRVRAHRRPSRKKITGGLHGQGSLFEAHQPRRKTA